MPARRVARLMSLPRVQTQQIPWVRQWSGEVLARIYLALQRPVEALDALDRAAAEPPQTWQRQRVVESSLLLARAETLHVLGQHEAAVDIVRDLRDQLLQTAATFENRALSHSFLTNIEPHARALALAAEWLGETAAQPVCST